MVIVFHFKYNLTRNFSINIVISQFISEKCQISDILGNCNNRGWLVTLLLWHSDFTDFFLQFKTNLFVSFVSRIFPLMYRELWLVFNSRYFYVFSFLLSFTYYFWFSLQRRRNWELANPNLSRSGAQFELGQWDGPRCLSDENWETATRSQLLIDWKFKTNSSNYSQTPFVAVCP